MAAFLALLLTASAMGSQESTDLATHEHSPEKAPLDSVFAIYGVAEAVGGTALSVGNITANGCTVISDAIDQVSATRATWNATLRLTSQACTWTRSVVATGGTGPDAFVHAGTVIASDYAFQITFWSTVLVLSIFLVLRSGWNLAWGPVVIPATFGTLTVLLPGQLLWSQTVNLVMLATFFVAGFLIQGAGFRRPRLKE